MQKPFECYNPVPCVLAQHRTANSNIVELGTGFSQPEGKGTLGVVMIGEALGHEEAIDGLPFRPRAQAGSQLEDIFRRLGIKREQVFLWNILGCQPPNNLLDHMWYEAEAISCCMQRHFSRVVGGFQTPHRKTLVALGNLATRVLTGLSGEAYLKESVSNIRGYPFETKYGVVVPTYHPSYIRRGNAHLLPAVLSDIRKAINIAQGRFSTDIGNIDTLKYNTAPSIDEAWAYYKRAESNNKVIISYDIETPSSGTLEEDEREDEVYFTEPIESVQFSLASGEAMFLPYKGEYITVAHRMMELPNRKIGWNIWFFDDPIMERAGFKFGGGIPIDLMWVFKQWQPRLERGLQKVASLFDFPFPWKHLYGSDIGLYGCADVDAPQRILPRLVKAMKELSSEETGASIWDGFVEQNYQIHPIMVAASKRGIPVNIERHEKLRGELKEQLVLLSSELQILVPDELKNITPKRKIK